MTEKITTEGAGLEDLELVLERFGSDRTRWPAPVRRNFAGLLATDLDAQERLREAEALDRLLDLAPMPQIDTRALTDRILAAAAADASVTSSARSVSERSVSEHAVGSPQGVAPFRRPAAPPIRQPRSMSAAQGQWPAAALLAASLLLGVFSGFWGTFDTTVGSLMTASASTDSEIDPGQLALDGDGISMFAEDLL